MAKYIATKMFHVSISVFHEVLKFRRQEAGDGSADDTSVVRSSVVAGVQTLPYAYGCNVPSTRFFTFLPFYLFTFKSWIVRPRIAQRTRNDAWRQVADATEAMRDITERAAVAAQLNPSNHTYNNSFPCISAQSVVVFMHGRCASSVRFLFFLPYNLLVFSGFLAYFA